MPEIRFYHLTTKTLEQALPEILTKAVGTARRVIVKGQDDKSIEALNTHLWVFQPDSFLPHGSKKDGKTHAADQPIWLTTDDENPNSAQILILTGGAETTLEHIKSFDLCCEMLDGNDDEAVTAARARWKIYKDEGFDLTYWQQTPAGGWEKKA